MFAELFFMLRPLNFPPAVYAAPDGSPGWPFTKRLSGPRLSDRVALKEASSKIGRRMPPAQALHPPQISQRGQDFHIISHIISHHIPSYPIVYLLN
jgi:hypothetical protein